MQSFFRPQSLWLVVPPVVLCCLDFGITLYGQSDVYWSGGYRDVNELSPSFAQYLAIHPLAFVAAGLLWIGIFSSLIAIVPEKLGMTVSVAIVLGHMSGTASWLAYRFHSYQAANVLMLLTAILIVAAFNNGRSDTGRTLIDWSRSRGLAWTRWILVALLAALPIWWFLIPH